MLTMSNSFEMYHRQQQQQQQQQQHNSATSTTSILSNNNSSKSIPIGGPGMCGSSSAGGSGGNSPSGAGKESIHSGQFMVSHFEAEEAQDDDDNDNEIKMLDPEDPSLSKPDEPNACTEVQLYMPIKVKEYGSMNTIASHLEIETSLTKLFKCMNLAYSQKLTSPKWNHFKGVRLRWKDKIRLNNVIWRCWHMQFILKRRTPVCQFASPLDVDIHSNPQSVVLEGKYWKRQLAVIKAEYRKWRRNSKSNKTGCMIYDTKSEIDLFEWSLSNDRNLMLPYDWTTDTLFSAINGPFPFPDQREIARGAGNSDFIQPSLGPLQPNLDEIGLTFEELLLQSTRLPPVPEEVSDDMLKSVDYGFPALLGPDHMDSTNIVDVTNQNQGMSNGEDTNMMELNTPLSSMQYSDLERQFQDNANNSLLGSQTDLSNSLMMSGNQSSDSDFNSSPKRPSVKTFPISLDTSTNQSSGTMGKSVIKGRISKTSQRPFRREPHNYDKAQPTLHQTEIYQRLMAERLQQQQQQQQQHQLQHMQHTFGLQLQPPSTPNQSHQTSMQMSQQFSQGMLSNSNNSNNSNNYTVPQAQNLLSLPTNSSIKTYPISTKSNLLPNVKLEASQSAGNVLSMFNISTASTGDAGFHNQTSSSMGNLSQVCPSNGNTSTISFKAYPNVQSPFQKSASTGNYINMRATDASNEAVSQINALFLEQQQQQSQHVQQHSQSLPLQLHPNQLLLPTSATNTSSSSSQQQPQQILPKEMFRSNSLPLNSSLQKLEPRIEHFAVPKYQAKSNNKSRSRSNSNSIQQQNTPSSMVSGMSSGGPTLQIPQLQGATSDPMLNSTLAQLLTAPSLPPPTPNALNTNTNYSPSATSSHAQAQQQSPQQQQQHHAQHQTGQSLPKPISPKKSNSLPVPAPALMIHSPPGNKMLSFPPPSGAHIPTNISLSPDSFNEQDSPLSPTHNLKYPRDTQRRAGHIHAEQKRRYNIKNGFDMLHSLIPQLQQNPNAKLSKAAMLQKGADYIKQLRSERNVLKEKMEALKQERDSLNSSLSHLHSILPANGAPVTRQRTERVRQLYEHYVRCRTMQNWKFWILGLILEPLLASYTTSVSSASTDELRRTVFLWVDQHCSLVDLRPAVSNKLRYLSTTTDILSDPPSTLQEEVAKAINNTPGQHPNLNGS